MKKQEVVIFPCLEIQSEGIQTLRYPIMKREATVGRDISNDICIKNHLVSKFHAKLLVSNQSVTVIDLDSVNKTKLNGRIVKQATVRYGDEIQFARVRCRLVQEEPHERVPENI